MMNLTSTHDLKGRMNRLLLPPSPSAEGRLLLEECHVRQVTVLSPLGDERSLSPEQLSERAWVVTAVLEEILSRTRTIPHGGINE